MPATLHPYGRTRTSSLPVVAAIYARSQPRTASSWNGSPELNQICWELGSPDKRPNGGLRLPVGRLREAPHGLGLDAGLQLPGDGIPGR